MADTLTGLFQNGSDDEGWCFDFKHCTFQYVSLQHDQYSVTARGCMHAAQRRPHAGRRLQLCLGLVCWKTLNAVFFRCLASVTTAQHSTFPPSPPPPLSECLQ